MHELANCPNARGIDIARKNRNGGRPAVAWARSYLRMFGAVVLCVTLSLRSLKVSG